MFRIAKLCVIPAIFAVSACENTGSNYTPVIDGPVSANYNADLAQCQALAASQSNVDGRTAQKTVAGAGAAAAGMALVDNTGSNVRDAAAVGAIAGVTAGVLDQQRNKEAIVRNCMRSRGYNVVG